MSRLNERVGGGESETFIYEDALTDGYRSWVFVALTVVMACLFWSRSGLVYGLSVAGVGALLNVAMTSYMRRENSDVVLDDLGIRRFAFGRLWYEMNWSDIECVLVRNMYLKGYLTKNIMFTICPSNRCGAARRGKKITISGTMNRAGEFAEKLEELLNRHGIRVDDKTAPRASGLRDIDDHRSACASGGGYMLVEMGRANDVRTKYQASMKLLPSEPK